MLRNRTIEVKLAKDKKKDGESQDHIDYDEVIASAVTGVIFIIGAYMASDTIRQSLIHVVTTKVK